MNASCIIAYYNEGRRIIDIINELIQIPLIKEIIIVDDGSSIQLPKEIFNTAKVKTIISKKNEGKVSAVRKGLQFANEPLIFLCDADLLFVKAYEIKKAINSFINQKKFSMYLLKRGSDRPHDKLLRSDIVLTGQRIIWKKDLKKILANKLINRYQLELAINFYMKKQRFRVAQFPTSITCPGKIGKDGIIKGLWKEMKMSGNLLDFFGWWWPIKYPYHLYSFAREKMK